MPMTVGPTYTVGGEILSPIQWPHRALLDAIAWGPNLTVPKGQAVGIKTADKLGYLYNNANVDGTQVCVGINRQSFKTDAAGKVYYVSAPEGAGANYDQRAWSTSPIFICGCFDPLDLTGVDAAALVDLLARTLHNGFIYIP